MTRALAKIQPPAEAQPELCSACGKQPRLGALSRCASCVQAAAAVDRQARAAAEVRSQAREKIARDMAAEARADAERQAALERLAALYLEFAASPEGVRLAEAQQTELTAPRNDPQYVATLEEHGPHTSRQRDGCGPPYRRWRQVVAIDRPDESARPRPRFRSSSRPRPTSRSTGHSARRSEGWEPRSGSGTGPARQAYLRPRSTHPYKQTEAEIGPEPRSARPIGLYP
jgi:hypothetical protein